MQSKEVMKKLADNYETLVFVANRHPSSMSRLKNLLMSEGISETSARRKIADLDTETGCMVVEEYGSLKLNQKLISNMLLQIQNELKIPNHFEEEQKAQVAILERKIETLERQKTEEVNGLKLENVRKNGVIEKLRKDVEKQQKENECGYSFERDRYLEVSRKLEVAEEKISRMKEGVFSYLKVCREDRREERLKKRCIKREAKARQKYYAELERKWEEERKQKEKQKRKQIFQG